MTTAARVNDREATADRLLRSSLDHSYEPSIDIDWDAPLVDGAWGLPEHRVSLYGTELWEGLTDEQRRTLSIHEVSSVARIRLRVEIIHQLQREAMKDETVQPLTRAVNKIHVTEEARHVRYAREELIRIMPRTNAVQKQIGRYLSARIAFVVARNLIHADVYASVGIDPEVGKAAALANPHHRDTLRWSARKLVPFLREQGLIGGPSEVPWRQAHPV